jgi:predicted dehydrogenase
MPNPPGELEALTVLIVGCGSIAGGFDADRPGDAPPFTHAGAFSRHGGYVLAACMEPDSERLDAFLKRWNIPIGYTCFEELQNCTVNFDVVSICSPTALHASHLQAALALKPKLVFCEKPVTGTVAETSALVEAFDRAGVKLTINHTRRWAPDILRLREQIQAGAWGKIRSATGTYGKGILNNGGHMVDLLICLLGPLSLLSVGRPVWDFWNDDPTIPAMLQTSGGVSVQLSVSDARDFAFFELQIVAERGVIVLEGGGLKWRIGKVIDSPLFKGYRSLDMSESMQGEYALAMTRAAENIHNAVACGEALKSTGHGALEAQRLCEQIKLASLAQFQTDNR